MSDTVIKVENLSKLYRLGVVGTGTLSHDINRWWHKIRGKEDPYSLVGETNVQDSSGDSEYVWALKDINFEVKQGEVLGIIGKNGAGKSTLLKILSKVTGPTTGTIKAKGRIASLLEVGTGFHPELTGRENIYLNGTILGMSRQEVTSKLEEIVEFAGVARYVDTPVKRYSSGMKVRLGFAVAAHLEPEILIVDEVLAVGDAEFQKKAVGKMQEVSGQGGRTVLFVSHNMGSVKSLCTKGLVLSNGTSIFEGDTTKAVDFYLNQNNKQVSYGIIEFDQDYIGELSLVKVEILDRQGRIRSTFSQSEAIKIRISFFAMKSLKGVRFNLRVKTVNGEDVFVTSSYYLTKNGITKGVGTLELEIPSNLLNSRRYIFGVNAGIPGRKMLIEPMDLLSVDIEGENIGGSDYNEKWPGLISPKIDWTLK